MPSLRRRAYNIPPGSKQTGGCRGCTLPLSQPSRMRVQEAEPAVAEGRAPRAGEVTSLAIYNLSQARGGKERGLLPEAASLISALKLTFQVGGKTSVPGREDDYGFSVVCNVSQPLQCL